MWKPPPPKLLRITGIQERRQGHFKEREMGCFQCEGDQNYHPGENTDLRVDVSRQ